MRKGHGFLLVKFFKQSTMTKRNPKYFFLSWPLVTCIKRPDHVKVNVQSIQWETNRIESQRFRIGMKEIKTAVKLAQTFSAVHLFPMQ